MCLWVVAIEFIASFGKQMWKKVALAYFVSVRLSSEFHLVPSSATVKRKDENNMYAQPMGDFPKISIRYI